MSNIIIWKSYYNYKYNKYGGVYMIYLDNAATTAVYDEVIDEMIPYLKNEYANPSGMYGFATNSRKVLNNTRKTIAKMINAEPTEIYFTSGGSEADNFALKGTAFALKHKGKHLITTNIEHHAILNSCRQLEKLGYEITYVPVNDDGIVDPNRIKNAIRTDTILISVMSANNEIGTIQPINDIGEIAHKKNIWFHTDAVQSLGHIEIDINKIKVDMLSASAHKFNGPKGIGFIYIKNGIKPFSLINGGKQERNMRAGTENIPAIAGLNKAVSICMKKDNFNASYITKIRNHFIKRLIDEIDNTIINGSIEKRLPGNVNVSFLGVSGEAVQIQLDRKGICCSTGSACDAGVTNISHVINAINTPPEYAPGTLRFTFSDANTIEEADITVNALKEIVTSLRAMK